VTLGSHESWVWLQTTLRDVADAVIDLEGYRDSLAADVVEKLYYCEMKAVMLRFGCMGIGNSGRLLYGLDLRDVDGD